MTVLRIVFEKFLPFCVLQTLTDPSSWSMATTAVLFLSSCLPITKPDISGDTDTGSLMYSKVSVSSEKTPPRCLRSCATPEYASLTQ